MLYRAGTCRGSLLEDKAMWAYQSSHFAKPLGKHWIEIKQRILAITAGVEVSSAIIDYAQRIHPKRALRVRALFDIIDSGNIHVFDKYMRNITGKMKMLEYAKPGKPGRIIGDYTCPASLLGGWIFEKIKESMVHEFNIGRIRCRFVKSPNLQVLDQVFHDLVNSYEPVLVFFSDDACFAVTVDGTRYMYNLDISKCDASHGECVFNRLSQIVEDKTWKIVIDKSIEQCRRWIDVFSPKDNDMGRRKKKMFSYRKHGCPFLSSGWTGTTAINNVAIISIAENIDSCLPSMKGDNIQELLVKAASFAGYLITCEHCTTYPHLQFLKHSPVMSEDGRLTAMLNLGVVFRTLGQCDGDLPGSGDISSRGELFNAAVLKGMCHMGDHAIHDALMKRFPHNVDPRYTYFTQSIMSEDVRPRIMLRDVMERYQIDLSSIDELCLFISSAVVGDRIHSRATESFFKKDYGL